MKVRIFHVELAMPAKSHRKTNPRLRLLGPKRKAEDAPNGTLLKRPKESESPQKDGRDGQATLSSPVKAVPFPVKVCGMEDAPKAYTPDLIV